MRKGMLNGLAVTPSVFAMQRINCKAFNFQHQLDANTWNLETWTNCWSCNVTIGLKSVTGSIIIILIEEEDYSILGQAISVETHSQIESSKRT